MQPVISVVVLNWNGMRFIETCLLGLSKQTYKKIEVIVVDNGSVDGSLEKVIEKFPYVKIIKNKKNMGFSEGMNIGIAAATGDYIMTLNMDVYLERSCIGQMVDTIDHDLDCGAIMGKEFTWDVTGFSDVPSISSGPGYLKKRGQGTRDIKRIDKRTFSFGAMGSFPMFRASCLRKLYDKVGYYFDPKFVTGWEDKDIFFRLHHLGYRFIYEPNAIGYHYGSGSVGEAKRLIDKDIYYQTMVLRNRYYFILKNYPKWLIFRHFAFLTLTEFLMLIYFIIYQPKTLKALWLAQLDFLRNIKTIIKDRKLIQADSKLTKNQILNFFKGY